MGMADEYERTKQRYLNAAVYQRLVDGLASLMRDGLVDYPAIADAARFAHDRVEYELLLAGPPEHDPDLEDDDEE